MMRLKTSRAETMVLLICWLHALFIQYWDC